MEEVSIQMENHANNQDTVEKSSDGFVAVDIGALSSETDHVESCSSSRKGSQRNGAENAGGVLEDKRDVTHAHVAQPGGPSEAFRVMTPRMGGGGGGKSSNNRRQSRRRSAWHCMLGPRRVLFVFAALSSMGTLILLYFTLSIANQNG